MARRSGLGKGLSSLIPPGEATSAGERRGAGPDRHPDRRHHAQPASAARALRRGVAGGADGVDPADRRAAAGAGAPGRVGQRLRADRRRASLAGRRPRRPGDDPGDRAPHRRPRRRRAGARREPPPPGPHAARGGGRLPAADRGLRAHPRAGRRPGRQEPLGDHQHAAPARPAAVDPAPAGRRPAVAPVTPGRCSAPPTVRCRSSSPARRSTRAGPSGRSEEAVKRGGAPRRRWSTTNSTVARAGPDHRRCRAGARARGCGRRACSSSRSCSPSTSTRGSPCRWAPSGAGSRSTSPISRISSGSTAG